MTDKAALAGRVSEIWAKFRPSIMERMSTLEQTAAALGDGPLDPETRQIAVREAHKLAGSVGTFGFAEASLHARAIEELLEANDEIDGRRLGELVVALRHSLEQPPPTPAS